MHSRDVFDSTTMLTQGAANVKGKNVIVVMRKKTTDRRTTEMDRLLTRIEMDLNPYLIDTIDNGKIFNTG